MIEFRHKGDFSNVVSFLKDTQKAVSMASLKKYGQAGVDALASATPVDTGLTANSWYYEIEQSNGHITINFCNSNVKKDWCNIAIIIQYGHLTGTGGWVEGRDYINPAIQPVFDNMVNDIWREVTNR